MMQPTNDIEQQVSQVPIHLNPKTDEIVFNKLCEQLDQQQPRQESLKEHPIFKLALAACLLLAVLFAFQYLTNSPAKANVAWADVVHHITQVDYVHFYDIESKQEGYTHIREGWYAHGQFRVQNYQKEQIFDNGEMLVVLDANDQPIKQVDSMLKRHGTIHEALMWGLISLDVADYEKKIPIQIGEDFLVYEFGPPQRKEDWIEKLTVTVGKNSLIPIQIKTYYRKGQHYVAHRFLVFDYEASKKPLTFFTQSPMESSL